MKWPWETSPWERTGQTREVYETLPTGYRRRYSEYEEIDIETGARRWERKDGHHVIAPDGEDLGLRGASYGYY
jgi:hypothetical protein